MNLLNSGRRMDFQPEFFDNPLTNFPNGVSIETTKVI